MNKETYILPIKSSIKRPPIFSFFSIMVFQLSVIMISVLVDRVLTFGYLENILSFNLTDLTSNSILILLPVMTVTFVFLKENIVRSSFLNKLYFKIIAFKAYKEYTIAYLVFMTAILTLSIVLSNNFIVTTIANFFLVASSIALYFIFLYYFISKILIYKEGFGILDDIIKSKFEVKTSNNNVEYTVQKQDNGPMFVYLNIGTLDLVNGQPANIEETKQKLNNLLNDNSKITDNFSLFIMDLPPNQKQLLKKDRPLKSLVIRFDLQKKESLKNFDNIYREFQKIFDRLSILTEREIKFFYLTLLSIIGDKNTFEIEKSSDIDELFKNLEICKILDNKLMLTSKLHEKIIESNVSISSMYNIENNSDVNNNDNIYSFGENPLASLLSKVYSENRIAVLSFSRLSGNENESETGIRIAKGVDHKFKDLKAIEKKLNSEKKKIMEKSHKKIEKITKSESGDHFIVKLDIIDSDFGKSTSQFSNQDTVTYLARQNYVQVSSLKNILDVSKPKVDYSFIGNEFLVNETDIFTLGMFSQDNSYEEGIKSIYLGYLNNAVKKEPVLLNMGKYQMRDAKTAVSNGHAIFLADSGHGKTTLLKSILYQKLAFVDQQVIILDKEDDFVKFGDNVKRVLSEKYNRRDFVAVNYGPEFIKQNPINPFNIAISQKLLKILKSEKNFDYISKYEDLLTTHTELLKDYFFMRIMGLKKDENILVELKYTLGKLIYNTYNYEIGSNDFAKLVSCLTEPPTLLDFKKKLELYLSAKPNKNVRENDKLVKDKLEFLLKMLNDDNELKKYFVTSSNIAKLSDTLNSANLIIFNTKDLYTNWQKRLYLMLLITNLERIIRDTEIVHVGASKDTNFPNGKALIVDELHKYFDDASDADDFTLFITTFLKDVMLQGRKRNIEIYVASQNLSFTTASEAYAKNAKAIVTAASYRFLGYVPEIDRKIMVDGIKITDKDNKRLDGIQKKIWAYSEARGQLVFVDSAPHEDVIEFLI
jgi:hypothetical protein